MKLKTAAKLRGSARHDFHEATVTRMLKALAVRHAELSHEASVLGTEIEALINQWRPDLLTLVGVGPVGAAKVLLAWSHPGRYRSEAAFAAHAGTSPVAAPSGMTTRHRLNHGGDRKLNAALHTIAITRMRHDPATIAYIERRTPQY